MKWDVLKALFEEARALSAEERASFILQACPDDREMREQLTVLLRSDDEASAYFENFADDLRGGVAGLTRSGNGGAEADIDPLIGESVRHYEIQDLLGGGGMGSVFKARHRTLDHYAALKFLPPQLSSDEEAKARFVSEARMAYSLDHPNICTIYDIGETEGGGVYIAMAYYDGETIKKKIERGPLPNGLALDYAAQTCEGLAKAHQSGIVHRDIKPANILVTSEGVVKLLDFGVAEMLVSGSPKTAASTSGTLYYMSPEQISGAHVDARTDIWSLGVVLYEMLTGAHPFAGARQDPEDLVNAILIQEPEGISDLLRGTRQGIFEIVERCLRKSPAERYQSMATLYGDIYRTIRTVRASPGAASQAGDGDQTTRRSRIFLSYAQGSDEDRALALTLRRAIGREHRLFEDEVPVVSGRWFEQLERTLSQSDYMVVLISNASVNDEMVAAELELARRLASDSPAGHPLILPVRLELREEPVYPIDALLESTQRLLWSHEDDTAKLIEELLRIFGGGDLDTPAVISSREGHDVSEQLERAARHGLHLSSGGDDLYVERQEDETALAAVRSQGVTLTIKGTRKMGKTSLLVRVLEAARKAGKAVSAVDFAHLEGDAMRDADAFFRVICRWILDDLDLEDTLERYWTRPVANPHRCSRLMANYVLPALDRPLFFAMDNVHRVLDTNFHLDFFSMLRSWHNNRAIDPRWKTLDLCLVTSTEPYQLVENPNLSPFNVGKVIELQEFTLNEIRALNQRYGAPLQEEQIRRFMDVLGGHPYLIRRALSLVLGDGRSPEALLRTVTEPDGPFGDHLKYHLLRLYQHPELRQAMHDVLTVGTCDSTSYWRLYGAGLVRKLDGRIVPRCPLYADFLRGRIDD